MLLEQGIHLGVLVTMSREGSFPLRRERLHGKTTCTRAKRETDGARSQNSQTVTVSAHALRLEALTQECHMSISGSRDGYA